MTLWYFNPAEPAAGRTAGSLTTTLAEPPPFSEYTAGCPAVSVPHAWILTDPLGSDDWNDLIVVRTRDLLYANLACRWSANVREDSPSVIDSQPPFHLGHGVFTDIDPVDDSAVFVGWGIEYDNDGGTENWGFNLANSSWGFYQSYGAFQHGSFAGDFESLSASLDPLGTSGQNVDDRGFSQTGGNIFLQTQFRRAFAPPQPSLWKGPEILLAEPFYDPLRGAS